MFHYVNAITNTKGDALIGYYVKLTDPNTGDEVDIFADQNSTPIISVSGIANAAKVDSNGNASFYVPSGEYDVAIYATDGTTHVDTIFGIPMVDVGLVATNAGTRSELAARAASDGATATLTEVGREGLFVFQDGDYSAEVAEDTEQGLYIAPDSDDTGASGAWVRKYDGAINAFWFMSAAEVADVRAFDYSENVTDALRAASSMIEFMDGGELLLPPGGYLVGEQTLGGTTLDGLTDIAWAPEEILTIKNCVGSVKISGYGAVLKAADGLKYGAFDPVTGDAYASTAPFLDYDYYSYPYRAMINIEGNETVVIEGVELDGNSTNMEIGGEFGDSNWQNEGSGIWNKNNGAVTIKDVYAHHQPLDGVISIQIGVTETSVAKPLLMENVRCLYNGRQGHSLTGNKRGTMRNCDFSMTGQAVNTGLGTELASSPGAGLDIEAESTLIRDVVIDNCRMVGNHLQGLIGASGNSKGVTVQNCLIEVATVSRPRYHFINCTFLGKTSFALPIANEYLTLSTGVSLTIAGSGPYTLTRASGSFVDDGWAEGALGILPSTFSTAGTVNSGLAAENKNKRFRVTGVTATELTVSVLNGETLTAEGPIASCHVCTPHNEEDGFRFERCHFSHDTARSGTGTLINAAQSDWDEARFSVWRDCTGDWETVLFPATYVSGGLNRNATLTFQNCNFRTAYSGGTLHAIAGYFQGVNFIVHGTQAPTFDFGTASQIDYGVVYVNGTAAGLQTYTASNVTTDRSYDADTAVVAETNDVLGTLIADLRARNLIA